MQISTVAWNLSHVARLVLQGVAMVAIPFATASITQAAGLPKEAGVWIDDTGDGAIKIEPCGPTLCGKIVWLKNLLNDDGEPLHDRHNPDASKHARPICGLQILGQLKPQDSGGFDEGWVYDPKEGKSYSVAITLAGADQLQVTGYLGVKLLGKTMYWTRAKTELPSCDTAAAAPAPVPEKIKAVPAAKPAAVVVPTVAAAAKVMKASPAPETKSETLTPTQPAAAASAGIKAAKVNSADVETVSTGDAKKAANVTAGSQATTPASPEVKKKTAAAKTGPAKKVSDKTVKKATIGEALPWSNKTTTPAAPSAKPVPKTPEGGSNLGASSVHANTATKTKPAANNWPLLDVYSAAP